MDDRHERSRAVDRRDHRLRADASIRARRDAAHRNAIALEQLATLFRGRMLDRGRHNRAPRRIARRRTTDRNIARLGAAAGEGDLVRACANQRGDLRARILDCVMRAAAKRIGRGRIAELIAQERQHGVEHRGIDRGRGVVIEIDTHLNAAS